MTHRLYYTDSYRTEFDATVTAVTDLDGRPAIVLDESCFYPTSGGQPYDTGVLDGIRIVDVVAAAGAVHHITEKPADTAVVGQTVHGHIDWPRRYDHMQQHSGQHLISQVFDSLFGYETLSVHFGDDESTLDLGAAEVTEDELAQAERMANEQVWRAIPIKTYFVSDEDVDSIPLRRPPKVSGKIRIVEIVDTDWSACGGTHTHTTAEIGPIKFTRQQHMRGQARLTFLCGHRALNDYDRKHALITAAAALYDTEIGQIPGLISRDMDRLKELHHLVAKLQEERLTYLAAEMLLLAETVSDRSIVAQAFDDLDANSVKALANHLIEKAGVVALLGSTQGGKATVIFARAEGVPLHAGNLLQATLSEFGGGGGGRAELAQGGGVPPEKMSELLNYAIGLVHTELEGAS